MNPFNVLLVAILTAASFPVAAGPYASSLSACLSDNTTGKERKELARWMFIAMASHPEMNDLSTATQGAKLRVNQVMGHLVTKLISESCSSQARAAIEKEGSAAVQEAFGSLGKLAMQELMSNPEVSTAVGAFEAHLDRPKIQSALAPK